MGYATSSYLRNIALQPPTMSSLTYSYVWRSCISPMRPARAVDAIRRVAQESGTVLNLGIIRHWTVATRFGGGGMSRTKKGRATIANATLSILDEENSMELYGTEDYALRAVGVARQQPNAGDIVLFAPIRAQDIISFRRPGGGARIRRWGPGLSVYHLA